METDKSLEDLLIEGLQEALAFERGEIKATARVRVTGRTARVDAPPAYTAERVRAVREKLRVSRPIFAAALGVSERTVEAWEQGKRVPDGAARRLLEVVEEHPDTLLEKVHA